MVDDKNELWHENSKMNLTWEFETANKRLKNTDFELKKTDKNQLQIKTFEKKNENVKQSISNE